MTGYGRAEVAAGDRGAACAGVRGRCNKCEDGAGWQEQRCVVSRRQHHHRAHTLQHFLLTLGTGPLRPGGTSQDYSRAHS